MTGNVDRFPWSSTTNATSEQLREANDWEHIIAARESIRMMLGSVKEAEASAVSDVGRGALSDTLAWLDDAEEHLTRALSECGFVEPKQQAAE